MEVKAGPSVDRVCRVCENMDMGGDTCPACHMWFKLSIDFYRTMEESSLCEENMAGNSCPDFACFPCKIDRYLRCNAFSGTTKKCAVCNSLTYVDEENPICSNCRLLWQERLSYSKATKCSCKPAEGKVCQVCCLKRLVQYMKEKDCQHLGNSQDFTIEPVARNGTGWFYSEEFNVKCNISNIPRDFQERAIQQLTRYSCCVELKLLRMPPVKLNQEDTDCLRSICGNLNTISQKRKRLASSIDDDSEEEDCQLGKEPLMLPSKQSQVYNVESITETCLRLKKPTTSPCIPKPTYEKVDNSSSSFDSSSASSSETSPRSEFNNVISEFSSTTNLNSNKFGLHSSKVDSCHTSGASCDFIASPLPFKSEEEKSPVLCINKKSQATESALSFSNQNVQTSFDALLKKDEGVQTEGFFEDLLLKMKELHKNAVVIQEAIDHSKLSPRQSATLLRNIVQNVIETCEPVSLRDSVSSHFSSPFAPKSDLQSSHSADLAGSPQGEVEGLVTLSLDSLNHSAKATNIGPKSKKSSKISKESFKKSPVVVLNRLTLNDLRRYGVELRQPHLSSAKTELEKRPRKSSLNSESSLSARDSISENVNNSSPVAHSAFTTPASVSLNQHALDYEDGSLESTLNCGGNPSVSKHMQDPESSKHSDRVQETKTKSERKTSKEKQRTKSGDKGKKPQMRQKRSSESEKVQATDNILAHHESKESKPIEKVVLEPPIRKYRIPKTKSVLSAPPSVGLPSLVQENLDRLKKGVLAPPANAAPPKIPQKSSHSNEPTIAKPESLNIKNPPIFQDVDMFHEQNFPKHPGEKTKSILNICPSRKANGKGKVFIAEDLNSVRCISPVHRPIENRQEESLPQEQNHPRLPEGYVTSVLDELGYVPESSPRPVVKGIRPFHPPKVRAGNRNPPDWFAVAEKKLTSSALPRVPPETTEQKYKRSWKRLSSSSSSDEESSSPGVSDSESPSDGSTSTPNHSPPVFASPSSNSTTIQEAQPCSTDSTSSSNSDASDSPSSQSSNEFREPASLFGIETTGTATELLKTTQVEKQETDSSEAASSPTRCLRMFSPRRAPVPAVLVSPYRNDVEQPTADSPHMIPTGSFSRNEDILQDASDSALVHHEQGEDQEKMTAEKEEDKQEREDEEEEEEEEDILDIGLNDDELFIDPMYYEEPLPNQVNAQKKNQPNEFVRQDHDANRQVDAPPEQPQPSLSTWKNPIQPEIPPNRQPEPPNVAASRRFPTPNSIPTARVMPQVEIAFKRPPPPPVIAPSPFPNIAAIASKGMCNSFMRFGQCSPKPHETCAYFHEDDPEILIAVIQSYCESKKLLQARKLLGAMTLENSPYHKYLKLDIGRKMASIVVIALLQENRNGHNEYALSILVEANIPLLPDLVEKAIARAPDQSAQAAHALKKLYEKYTRAQISISKMGWEKIIGIMCSHKLWQETCAALATALQAQRYYTPSPAVINYLFGHALQTKVVQRIEQVCDILKGVGPHTFANLGFEHKREILNVLMKGSNPSLFRIYKHLFEYDKLIQLQQTPNAPLSHTQQILLQQNPPVLANPVQAVSLQRNLPVQFNRNTTSVAHPTANWAAPNVAWPSTSEVSAILKQNVMSHPTNTAQSNIGRNMHFDNFPEAKQLAEPAHRRNVAIRTSDPRIHALSRSQSHAAMNGVESKLPMLPPTSSCVLSADLVKVQAPDSNIHPSLGSVQVQPSSSNVSSPAEKNESARSLFVPKPSQDLDQDLFCNRTVPVHQGTKDANVIANEQPSTSAVQTSPFIQELNLLFANQSFDEGKFESLADLIIKCSAEDAFDDIFAAHLFSLITTKSLFDGESENEELQLSAITAKIIYRTLKEGNASTLPTKLQNSLIDIVGRVFCFLFTKYESATEEAERDSSLQESGSLTLACKLAGMFLEKCTKNPKVLIFIAECYIHKWTVCDPPLQEEGIEDLVDDITRALYILTEFHKLVAEFNIEKTLVYYENNVFEIILILMQLIFPTDNRQPEIECKSSSQAAIKGAFSDYQMEATKNAQRFRMVVDE